jgi:hypothetical protein
MGEKHHEPFQVSFNSSLRVDFQGSQVKSAAGHLVQKLPVPGVPLGQGPQRGRHGGASPGRVVPKRRLHRHEREPAESGGGTVLQHARDGGATDQRGPAGGEDDAAEPPPLPVERGATVAECDRRPPGEPVAAAGPAEEDRPLVADPRAAASGQDRRAFGEPGPGLLALAGRGAADTAPVRDDGAADRGAAGPAGSPGRWQQGPRSRRRRRGRSGACGASGRGGSSSVGRHGRGGTSPLGSD